MLIGARGLTNSTTTAPLGVAEACCKTSHRHRHLGSPQHPDRLWLALVASGLCQIFGFHHEFGQERPGQPGADKLQDYSQIVGPVSLRRQTLVLVPILLRSESGSLRSLPTQRAMRRSSSGRAAARFAAIRSLPEFPRPRPLETLDLARA